MTWREFVPERPPAATLQSRAGVHAAMEKALGHLAANGGSCFACRTRIDTDRGFAFILGWPAPLFACDDPACAAALQRLAEQISAPMLALGPS